MQNNGDSLSAGEQKRRHPGGGDRPSPVALVLAGGESLRMGTPKPFVRLHGIPLIEHVLERLHPSFDTVYIVGGDIQGLSYLGVPLIQDKEAHRGPLVGLYSGLAYSKAEWCFVVGCDMPFLSTAVIDYMATFLDRGDIVAAKANGRVQPLHSFYSRRCIPRATELISLGTTSLKALVGSCLTTIVPEEELARLDPGLCSFRDLDTPDQVDSLHGESTPTNPTRTAR